MTPTGYKRIEEFAPGDLVLSRDESDVFAPIGPQVVEEVFVREGRILEVVVRGRTIATTPEHPFWVLGHGWLPAGELQPGDVLADAAGGWVAVEAVRDAGGSATVYNLRVSDWHTYFVGDEEWGFGVWSHNSCEVLEALIHDPTRKTLVVGDGDMTFGRQVAGRIAEPSERLLVSNGDQFGAPPDMLARRQANMQALSKLDVRVLTDVDATQMHSNAELMSFLSQGEYGINFIWNNPYAQPPRPASATPKQRISPTHPVAVAHNQGILRGFLRSASLVHPGDVAVVVTVPPKAPYIPGRSRTAGPGWDMARLAGESGYRIEGGRPTELPLSQFSGFTVDNSVTGGKVNNPQQVLMMYLLRRGG